MLVRHGGLVAVGSLQEVRRAVPLATEDPGLEPGYGAAQVVEHDLGGRFVVPGFVDAHVHVVPGGLSLSRVELRGAASRGEFQERVAAVAGRLGPSDWLLGGLWDEGEWGGEMPTSAWLDEVVGDRPAYLTRHDMHLALASSAALQRAGIGPDTPDPEGGSIDRDPATGRPTGLLRERAMALMEAVIPEASVAERRAALAAASRLALSRGVTSLVDMGRYLSGDKGAPWRDLEEVYLPAATDGELSVRIATHVPLGTWRRLAAWVAVHGRAHPGGRLFWGHLKEFADGSLGSHTALLWAPYSDVGSEQEGGEGKSQYGQRALGYQELRDLAEAAVGAGLQVSIHAIGDRAVDEVLDAYRAALTKAVSSAATEAGLDAGDGAPESASEEKMRRLGDKLRLRIEHTQHLSDILNTSRALAAAGITPVPNPLHLLTDAAMLIPRLGPERAARAFALASLVRAGLRPALASDWPVVDLQPLTGVYAAVHRHAPPPEIVCAMRRSLPPSAAAAAFEVVGASHSGPTCDLDPADAAGGPTGGSLRVKEGREEEHVSNAGSDWESDSDSGGVEWPLSFNPEERLSLGEALLGHTAWGARAAGLEGYVGSLAAGLRADFVELSASLVAEGPGGELRLSERQLRRCLPAVVRTWLDGELVYDALAGGPAAEPEAPAAVAL